MTGLLLAVLTALATGTVSTRPLHLTARRGRRRLLPRGRGRHVRLPRPRPDQDSILDAGDRFKTVDAGRRYGKSTLAVIMLLVGHGPGWRAGTPALQGALHGGRLWLVVPDMRATGRDRWRDLKKAAKGCWTRKNETEYRLEFPGGGSVEVRSADDPDRLRGAGLDGVVVDESSLIAEEAWSEALRPALSDRKGWAVFLFTPKGKVHWTWPLWLRGASPELAAGQAAGDDYPGAAQPGWRAFHRPSSANPLMDAEELAAALAEVGSLRFSQEYLATFVVVAGEVFRREWFRYWVPDRDLYAILETDGGPRRIPTRVLRRRATADLAVSKATTADYTVVATYGLAPTGELIVLDVHRDRLEGPDLLPRFTALWRRWRQTRIGVEKTATQLAIVQTLQRAGLPVVGLEAKGDKQARAEFLAARCEAGMVYFMAGAEWLGDVEAELLEFPNPNAHDDIVDALGYAAEDAANATAGGMDSY